MPVGHGGGDIAGDDVGFARVPVLQAAPSVRPSHRSTAAAPCRRPPAPCVQPPVHVVVAVGSDQASCEGECADALADGPLDDLAALIALLPPIDLTADPTIRQQEHR